MGEIWKIDGTVVGTLMWTYQWWILANNLTSALITWKNFSSGLTNPKTGRGDLDSLFFFWIITISKSLGEDLDS